MRIIDKWSSWFLINDDIHMISELFERNSRSRLFDKFGSIDKVYLLDQLIGLMK